VAKVFAELGRLHSGGASEVFRRNRLDLQFKELLQASLIEGEPVDRFAGDVDLFQS
jgi:hypothetical protein